MMLAIAATAAVLFGAQPQGVSVTPVTHGGREAVEVKPPTAGPGAGETHARLPGIEFGNGEIEISVAADAMPGAADSVRAFAGVAFRMQDAKTYDAFYLRMKNGRAREQIQRNHSAQYISHPGWTWQKLRSETPGVYESYVDLVPGQWHRMRIVACGTEARLFVDGASQPTLVIHDLKTGAEARGGVALWVGPGTVARFADVKVTPKASCTAPD